MKSYFSRVFAVLFVLVTMVGLGACSKKNVPAQPGYGPSSLSGGTEGGIPGGSGGGGTGLDDARWRELGINSEAEKREFQQRADAFENQDVYFDYDSYMLSDPAKRTLDTKVEFIKRYPKVKVTVEGHCDERGTHEYNLALGERRANSAMQYLANSGINRQSLNVVSYGQEKPIAPGHDEASWAKNRRAHFVVNY